MKKIKNIKKYSCINCGKIKQTLCEFSFGDGKIHLCEKCLFG